MHVGRITFCVQPEIHWKVTTKNLIRVSVLIIKIGIADMKSTIYCGWSREDDSLHLTAKQLFSNNLCKPSCCYSSSRRTDMDRDMSAHRNYKYTIYSLEKWDNVRRFLPLRRRWRFLFCPSRPWPQASLPASAPNPSSFVATGRMLSREKGEVLLQTGSPSESHCNPIT